MYKRQDVCYLTEIIRQDNLEFQECLNEIRVCNISQKTKDLMESRIKAKLTNTNRIKPTKLFHINDSVDYIKDKALDKISKKAGEINEYELELKLYKKNEYLEEKIRKCCSAVQTLSLCVGSQVMLIYNLDIDSELVNGSRGVVISFEEDLPKVRFINGVERVIDYHIWEVEEEDKKLASVEQIPLKLAYAYSIHKSQGTSLDCAKIDLRGIFEYGMGYVALSRIKNLEGLSIKRINWDKIRAHPKAVEFYEKLKKK